MTDRRSGNHVPEIVRRQVRNGVGWRIIAQHQVDQVQGARSTERLEEDQ